MRNLILGVLCFGLLTTAASPAGAQEVFSHDDWQQVLQQFVADDGLVDYRGLAGDRAVFDAYIQRIESQSPASHPELFPDRHHELAYWINAYNAQVFQGVLEKGPDIDSVWGFMGTGAGFFRLMSIRLGGEKTNLQALENETIREGYKDPRIHAALNCASISCPRLPREAFTGDQLETQLEAAMAEFVGSPVHVKLDRGAREVHVSKIFDWFEKDFLDWEKAQGNGSPKLTHYLNRYRPDGGKIPADYDVEILAYDKGLNAQR